MSDSLGRTVKQSDVVKSVFYAVVMSAWASTICSHTKGVQTFLKWIGNIASDASKYSAALMSIGVFAFLTLYFYDEWRYGDEKKYEGYPHECLSVQCMGWSFYLFQVCLIGCSLEAAAVCGIAGTILITVGLISSLKWRCLKNRFFYENVVYIVALIMFVRTNREWSTWLLILPICFVILRLILRKLGLPTALEKGSDKDE